MSTVCAIATPAAVGGISAVSAFGAISPAVDEKKKAHAEEFKAKPILLNIFSEEETEDNSPKKEAEETGEKQGFFKKLFRKK